MVYKQGAEGRTLMGGLSRQDCQGMSGGAGSEWAMSKKLMVTVRDPTGVV